MSTGAEAHSAFIQGNQGTMEQDPDPPDQHASQSTIFQLLQEASKLTTPAHNSLLDSNPYPMCPNKISRADPFIVKRESKDPHSFHASNSASLHSSSHTYSCDLAMNGAGDNHEYKNTASVEPSPRCNSPWEVMSLINLQCERLLHHRDLGELDSSSVASPLKLCHSTANLSTLASCITERGCECGGGGPEITSLVTMHPKGPSLVSDGKGKRACLRPLEDLTGEVRAGCSVEPCGFPEQWYAKDCKMDSIVQSQIPETDNTGRSEVQDQNATVYSQPVHRDTMEVKLSVVTGFEWNRESKEDRVAAKRDTLNVTPSENGLPQMHVSSASDDSLGALSQQLTCNSDEDRCVAVYPSLSTMEHLTSGLAVTLDFNSNLVFTVDSPSDTQPSSQSSFSSSSQSVSIQLSSEEGSRKFLQQDGKTTASEPQCTHDPTEETSPPVPPPSSLSLMGETNSPASQRCTTTAKPELPVGENAHPVPQQCSAKSAWRTKTPRKQPYPTRSADSQDPDFQGVTFRMHTELDDSREQCRLLITSKYSKELCKGVRKPRLRARSAQGSLRTSSSDEESDVTSVSKRKVCASCCTKKTPMWRDAEDGTPLCNACGIRYKKYRVRCVKCWHIPRKEGNSNSCCLKCGNFVRLTGQRKHTAW